ncbi:MAG: radical SAM protein, partial [Calditrichota bacterium]
MTLPAIKGRIDGSFMPDPPLVDNFGRTISYVRLSLTDKCNLRCLYCMPENMRFMPTDKLLSFEELERLMRLLAKMGISKVRLTGGEPFIRPGIMPFLHTLKAIPGIRDIHITTNGVSTLPFVEELAQMDIAGINLSLDTLDRKRFKEITRRNSFDKVMECFKAILRAGIPLKVNMVVMEQWNTDSLLPMAELVEEHPIEVRFIEEMPFNGTAATKATLNWNHKKILSVLQERYPEIRPIP